jgi:hypothetical protein
MYYIQDSELLLNIRYALKAISLLDHYLNEMQDISHIYVQRMQRKSNKAVSINEQRGFIVRVVLIPGTHKWLLQYFQRKSKYRSTDS